MARKRNPRIQPTCLAHMTFTSGWRRPARGTGHVPRRLPVVRPDSCVRCAYRPSHTVAGPSPARTARGPEPRTWQSRSSPSRCGRFLDTVCIQTASTLPRASCPPRWEPWLTRRNFVGLLEPAWPSRRPSASEGATDVPERIAPEGRVRRPAAGSPNPRNLPGSLSRSGEFARRCRGELMPKEEGEQRAPCRGVDQGVRELDAGSAKLAARLTSNPQGAENECQAATGQADIRTGRQGVRLGAGGTPLPRRSGAAGTRHRARRPRQRRRPRGPGAACALRPAYPSRAACSISSFGRSWRSFRSSTPKAASRSSRGWAGWRAYLVPSTRWPRSMSRLKLN